MCSRAFLLFFAASAVACKGAPDQSVATSARVSSDAKALKATCSAPPESVESWPLVLRGARMQCARSDSDACLHLGWSLKTGLDGPVDHPKAIAYLECACMHGNATGCSAWGTMFEHGHGVARDFARAARLYEAACNHGASDGCGILGV